MEKFASLYKEKIEAEIGRDVKNADKTEQVAEIIRLANYSRLETTKN